jgi:hypothetical protein
MASSSAYLLAIEAIETDLCAGISDSPWVNTDDDSGDVQRGMTAFAYHRFTHTAFGPQWTTTLHSVYRAAAAAEGHAVGLEQ